MKILNFGSCNIDYVYSVQHAVREGETISSHHREVFAGGKGLNQSVAAARAGGKVYHAGVIGNDGNFLKEMLTESGADVSFLRKEDCAGGHAVIQVNASGNNCIIVYPGTNAMASKAQVDEVLSHFEAGDLVMLQNEISQVPYIIDKAYRKGLRVVFNPSPFEKELKNIDLKKIAYLLLNETEAMELTGSDDPRAILDHCREHCPDTAVLLTLGSKGSVYSDAAECFVTPARKVRAVDTTAAGDTFTGYFTAMIAEGKSAKEAVELATVAAALSVMRQGAAPSIPAIDDVFHAKDNMI